MTAATGPPIKPEKTPPVQPHIMMGPEAGPASTFAGRPDTKPIGKQHGRAPPGELGLKVFVVVHGRSRSFGGHGEVEFVGRERRPMLTRAGRSEERRAELSTPVGRAGILGTEHLKQVDEFLAVVVVELHGGQQRGKRFFDIPHQLAAGTGKRTKMPGGRALGDLV